MASAVFSSSPTMASISPSSSTLRGCPLTFPTSHIAINPSFTGNKPRRIVSADAEPSLSPSPSFASSRPQKVKSSSKKQQVMLKFVWMDKNIGIGLDQVVPGQGTAPLSSYYFWPRKDAWEEIKTKLESKKWISRKQTILLLNQATDIINLWQQNATT